MVSPRLALKLKRHGIVYPVRTVQEAKRAGIPLSLACAILDQESGGGNNIFGHDPTIFVGAGKVTKRKYLDYKRKRQASGNHMMQGVGPCQLTYYTVQDRADQLGGCWRPAINMRVGFGMLASNIKTHGRHDGIRAYNGSGPAADSYATEVEARAAIWHSRLIGERT